MNGARPKQFELIFWCLKMMSWRHPNIVLNFHANFLPFGVFLNYSHSNIYPMCALVDCSQSPIFTWDRRLDGPHPFSSPEPRSFWPAAGIGSSGFVQHRKSANHGLPVKSGKSDWLRIWNEYSAHAQKIRSGQSSRSLPQVRGIVALGTRMVQRIISGSSR